MACQFNVTGCRGPDQTNPCQKCKRLGRQFGAHPFVNTAPNLGYRGNSQADKNCAICTAAGAVNLTHGCSLWRTGDVAEAKGINDCKTGMGDALDNQATNIRKFVCAMTGRKWMKIGKMNKEVNYGIAFKWMNKFPDKTVFALSVSGTLLTGGWSRCHWLNALKAGGTIRFFDFQSNRAFRRGAAPGGQNPASSISPFIGVITQTTIDYEAVPMAFTSTSSGEASSGREKSKTPTSSHSSRRFHSAKQSGSFNTDNSKCIVLAFPPAPTIPPRKPKKHKAKHI